MISRVPVVLWCVAGAALCWWAQEFLGWPHPLIVVAALAMLAAWDWAR